MHAEAGLKYHPNKKHEKIEHDLSMNI